LALRSPVSRLCLARQTLAQTKEGNICRLIWKGYWRNSQVFWTFPEKTELVYLLRVHFVTPNYLFYLIRFSS
jgi:hypothetical protein